MRMSNIYFRFLIRIIGSFNLLLHLLFNPKYKNIDFLIKYKTDFSTNVILIALCKLRNIKFVNIISEFYKKPSRKLANLLQWYDFYFGIKYLSRHADGLIVFSIYLRDYFIHMGYKQQILITPNIIDPTNFQTSISNNVNNTFVKIGAVGTSIIKDGLLDLIKSFEIVNSIDENTYLTIIGDNLNDNSFIPYLQSEVNKRGLNNKVSFTGIVDYKMIPELLSSFDILALTRPNDVAAEAGFPTKLGEYMACKKPVVVTSVGTIKKIFDGKDIVVLVEPGNYKNIAQGIRSLIIDKKKRATFGHAGYDWMMANLAYKAISKKIVNFLHNIQ